MKVLYKYPVDEISGWDGNINGTVSMRTNGIDIMRRHVIPNNPDTAEQIAAKLIFTLASQNFKTLSDEERATWTTFAGVDQITVMGKSVSLQDMPCYLRSDALSYMNDTAHLTTAPTALPGFSGTNIASVLYDVAGTSLSFDLTHNGVATEGYWLTRVTPKLASAQRHARKSDFRLIEGVAATSIIDVAASVQTMTFTDPLLTWATDDWMEIIVVPVSEDYAVGTPFRWRGQMATA